MQEFESRLRIASDFREGERIDGAVAYANRKLFGVCSSKRGCLESHDCVTENGLVRRLCQHLPDYRAR